MVRPLHSQNVHRAVGHRHGSRRTTRQRLALWSVFLGQRRTGTLANDPEVLLSVEDNANQSKGDKGPEAWKPPNEAVWCDYAVRWIGIKDKYGLSVNEQEKASLAEMLDACEGE